MRAQPPSQAWERLFAARQRTKPRKGSGSRLVGAGRILHRMLLAGNETHGNATSTPPTWIPDVPRARPLGEPSIPFPSFLRRFASSSDAHAIGSFVPPRPSIPSPRQPTRGPLVSCLRHAIASDPPRSRRKDRNTSFGTSARSVSFLSFRADRLEEENDSFSESKGSVFPARASISGRKRSASSSAFVVVDPRGTLFHSPLPKQGTLTQGWFARRRRPSPRVETDSRDPWLALARSCARFYVPREEVRKEGREMARLLLVRFRFG